MLARPRFEASAVLMLGAIAWFWPAFLFVFGCSLLAATYLATRFLNVANPSWWATTVGLALAIFDALVHLGNFLGSKVLDIAYWDIGAKSLPDALQVLCAVYVAVFAFVS